MDNATTASDTLKHERVNLEGLPALQQLEFAEIALTRAVARIRQASAPPDGLTRPILPVATGEVAKALGVEHYAIRDIEHRLDVLPGWNPQRTQRAYYPADVRRLRKLLIPTTTTGHVSPFVLSVCNQKGGVGKTTSSVGVAQAAASCGLKVLLIDLDPQASTTACFLLEKSRGSGTLVEGGHADLSMDQTLSPIILGDRKEDGSAYSIDDLVRRTHWDLIDLIPAMPDLSEAEFGLIERMVDKSDNEFWIGLRKELRRLRMEDYDLVVIDTPPAMSLIAVTVLLACHGMLIPIPPRNLDIESLKSYIRTTFNWGTVLSEHFSLELEWIRYLTSMMSPTKSRVEVRNDQIMRQELGGGVFLPDPILKLEALQRASGGAPTPFEVQPKKPPSAKRSGLDARRHLMSVYAPLIDLIVGTYESWGVQVGNGNDADTASSEESEG